MATSVVCNPMKREVLPEKDATGPPNAVIL
jgi:hypothetical protein